MMSRFETTSVALERDFVRDLNTAYSINYHILMKFMLFICTSQFQAA